MSISASLSSALSGLTAASRRAEVVASNVANAMTEGYGRRELEVSARSVGSTGQGVQVDGVTRHADLAVINDRRRAQAEASDQDQRATALRRIDSTLGAPDDPASLTARVALLENALIAATAQPASEARLSQVTDAVRGIAAKFGAITTDIQTSRTEADNRIKSEVDQVNTALTRIADLNSKVRATAGAGRDPSALIDQRQQVIDSVAAIIPLREVPRDGGQLALVTPGGAVLLDGAAAKLGFAPVATVVAGMTQGSGTLSGLTLNGRPIATSGETSPIAGGSLAGHFAVRDELAPEAQTRLDAVARDLIERFASPSVDPTLSAADAGLFTDNGAAFLPANETGLAGRLALNAAVDPLLGGDLRRLRDGLAATSPGAVGDSSQLTRLQTALTAQRSPVSGDFMPGNRSFATLTADLASGVATARLNAETGHSFASARADALHSAEMQGGVDTDQEMQNLLTIEQAYSANAKVIQTVDDMIKTLLSI